MPFADVFYTFSTTKKTTRNCPDGKFSSADFKKMSFYREFGLLTEKKNQNKCMYLF